MGARHMILIDQLIAWAIAHPGKGWRLAAQALGLSSIFVRNVVSSDAFRARYAQVQNRTIEELGIIPLRDKIAIAADMAVERIAEKVETMESAEDLIDAADLLLSHALGKPGATPGVQTPAGNTFIIQQAIMDGRAAILGGAVEHGTVDAALAPGLPHSAIAPPPIAEPEPAPPSLSAPEQSNQGEAP